MWRNRIQEEIKFFFCFKAIVGKTKRKRMEVLCKKKKRRLHKKLSGNLTISVCNEASGLFGAKMSGTLWTVGTQLCRIGKVLERRKALKEKRRDKKVGEVVNMLPLGVGRLEIRGRGWRERGGENDLLFLH